MLPRYEFWGINQHFRLWSHMRWSNAVENLLIFTILFVGICILIGIILSYYWIKKYEQKVFYGQSIFTLWHYPSL